MKKKALRVKLEARPNPDYEFYDYRGSLSIAPVFVAVPDLRSASEVCSKFIDEHELGAGNWTGGAVYDGETEVARVSYNGRVWESLPYPQCKEIKI